MENRIPGIHHVTAIAGDPQTNIDFYAGKLGLRLVKLTADTEMYWHRGGHELGQDDIDAAQQWLSRKSAVWENSKQAASRRG